MGAPLPPFAFLPKEIADIVSFRELANWPENLSDGYHYWVEKHGAWIALDDADFALLQTHGDGLPVWTIEKLIEAETQP